jgi:hypothetical protein
MIRLLIISILLNVIICFTIPDEFCKHKYFDSIIWTGFCYKLTRIRDNHSYNEWTVYYDVNNKSFYGFEKKLFSQSIKFDMYLKTISNIAVFFSSKIRDF